MKLILLPTIFVAGLLVSCASNDSYRPATKPEKIEFRKARLEVYPREVRQDPAHFANLRVAWAGIIVSNDASDEEFGDNPDADEKLRGNETKDAEFRGKIRMDTVFEHHYFHWSQDEHEGVVRLLLSPRGEGRFRMQWSMSRKDPDASEIDAMKYAAPGKLAIVYATPVSVDEDGTILLRYHYIRILDPAQFTTNELDYGRLGESSHAPNP